MSPTAAVDVANGPSLSCDEVLRVAHCDAVAVYRDLSEYQITIELLPDGWHVDYNLAKPLVAGGGPHYVVDPVNGKIISKRFEQ